MDTYELEQQYHSENQEAWCADCDLPFTQCECYKLDEDQTYDNTQLLDN